MKLYSKPNCPYCIKVKNFIIEQGLESKVEIDDSYNFQEVERLGGKKQFPMLVLGEQAIYESDVIMATLAKCFSNSVDEWDVPLVHPTDKPEAEECEACQ